jgi:proline utilization trans-activator
MGMHREGTYADFEPIERNVRRLVWWMLYSFEKVLCNYLGRPTSIDDAEVSTLIPDENMLDNKDLPPNLLEKLIEAARLSYRIRRRAYFVDGAPEDRTPPVHVARQLLQELEDWYSTIPNHLQISATMPPGHQRGALLVHIFYFYIRSLVTRDFLIQRVQNNICRLEGKVPDSAGDQDQVLALGEDCIVSAAKSLQCLNMLADLKLLNGVAWLDVFYIFHAVLLVCADFLARPKSQPDSAADIQRKASVRTILQSTRVIKLAPTYNILSQFAFQFAYITGATEVPDTSYQAPGERNILSPAPQMTPFTGPFTGHGLQKVLVENDHSNDYQNESANVLWDWFDLESHNDITTFNGFPAAFASSALESGMATGGIDQWSTRPMR